MGKEKVVKVADLVGGLDKLSSNIGRNVKFHLTYPLEKCNSRNIREGSANKLDETGAFLSWLGDVVRGLEVHEVELEEKGGL